MISNGINSANTSSDNDNSTEEPPSKIPRLFASYSKARRRSTNSKNVSVGGQLECYYNFIRQDNDETSCSLSFWKRNHKKLHLLFPLALQVLAVPATSAPVERLFSAGGLIMRPHRSRAGADLVSCLTVLKTNYVFLKKMC